MAKNLTSLAKYQIQLLLIPYEFRSKSFPFLSLLPLLHQILAIIAGTLLGNRWIQIADVGRKKLTPTTAEKQTNAAEGERICCKTSVDLYIVVLTLKFIYLSGTTDPWSLLTSCEAISTQSPLADDSQSLSAE